MWAVWITGLPGSGKSTITRELAKNIRNVQVLAMDEMRPKFVARPTYTEKEREYAYQAFIAEGLKRIKRGVNLIFDATAHRRAWRDAARSQIENFMEVYIKCDLETCIRRESHRQGGLWMSHLYKKALDRKKTNRRYEGLGEVVGVDVPYEENEAAEMVIDSARTEPREAAELIRKELRKRGWINA